MLRKLSRIAIRLLRWSVIAMFVLGVIALILIGVYAKAQPPTTPLMFAEHLSGAQVRHQWVPLTNISPHLVKAVIVAEDNHFCYHRGVDWGAMREVLVQIRAGKRPRGASTIPMQTVKNLFLWPQRSLVRKGLEIPLAMTADVVWSKRRMLELYLNIVEWGPGIYGAEAAARYHFGKSVRRLSLREAAFLAKVLPNPLKRHAGKPNNLITKLAVSLLKKMKTSRAARCVQR